MPPRLPRCPAATPGAGLSRAAADRRSALRQLAGLPVLLAATGPVLAAEELRLGGTGAALGTMRLLAEAWCRTQSACTVTVLPSLGSGGGIKAALAGAVQVGLSARPLTEAEQRAGAVAVEYGRTPLVFATAASAAANGVSQPQLVDMYAGRSMQWPDGSRLRLVMRPHGDTDTDAIKALSPAMRDAVSQAEHRPGMAFALSDQEAATQVATLPGALGTLTLAQLHSERLPLKALALHGVAPTLQALAEGRYPLTKVLWLVTTAKTTAAGHAFVAYVRSPAGRQLLADTGHWVR